MRKKGIFKMAKFNHHVRFSLALSLQFQEDNRAESMTILLADQIINLAGWLAALLTALLLWLNALPILLADLDSSLSNYLSGWSADLSFMAQAARLIARDSLGLYFLTTDY